MARPLLERFQAGYINGVSVMRAEKGFTLIELIIVAAIIGILAGLAIPWYQSYIASSQAHRALGEISSYKTAFEYELSRGGDVSNPKLGYVPSSLTTGSTAVDIGVVNADGSGHIQVTLGGSAHPSIVGVTLRLSRDVAGIWTCTFDPGSAPNWRTSYLPPGCSEI